LDGSDSGSIVEELEVVVWKKGFFGAREEEILWIFGIT
jgi:hypothetical protein